MAAAFADGTSFLLYFDIDDEFWSNDISDLLFARFSRTSVIMRELQETDSYLQSHEDISAEDKADIVEEQDFRLAELSDILGKFPELIKAAKDRLLKVVKNINQQLREYEQLV